MNVPRRCRSGDVTVQDITADGICGALDLRSQPLGMDRSVRGVGNCSAASRFEV